MYKKEKITNIVTTSLTVLLILVWIIGAFHGNKKHNLDPFSNRFYFCWYYGIESVWHKTDFNELNNEIKIASRLILENSSELNSSEMILQTDTKLKLRKLLKNLDTKELNYVMDGTRSILTFMKFVQSDMIQSVANFRET